MGSLTREYRMGISKFKYPEIPKSRDLDPVSTLGGNTVLVFEIPKITKIPKFKYR